MSIDSPPVVSVLMPTYKRPKLLRRAIRRVLEQTYPHFKLCIYDDASGDDSHKVVDEFAKNDSRIVYHCNEKNLGPQLNSALAIKEVDNPFYTFCADDDVLLPQHLEHAMDGFKKYPQAVFASNQIVCMDEKRRIHHISHLDSPAGLYNSEEGIKLLLKDPGILTGVVTRKDVLDSGITLDTEAGMLWDWDFCFQTLAKFPLVVTQKQGCIFVTHSSSFIVSSMGSFEWPGWLKMYQKIVNHPNLDSEIKKEVEVRLKDRLRSLMVKQVNEAILSKDFALADLSNQTLKEFFGSYRLYLKLKFFSTLCKIFPPYHRFLIFSKKMRSKRRVSRGNNRYQEYQWLKKYLDF
jgi:glycosyltransferase involved in cell wall biosynthesis